MIINETNIVQKKTKIRTVDCFANVKACLRVWIFFNDVQQ